VRSHGSEIGGAGDARVIEHLLASGEMLASQMPVTTLWSPEKRLAAAVLASALVNVRDHYGDPARAAQVAEDREWIRSSATREPFCFLRLCDVFGLDPDWVREQVERWCRVKRARRAPFSMHRHAA
jgi:hypothetical protein